MAELSAVAKLGALLEPGEAFRLAESLKYDRRMHVAVDEIRGARRSPVGSTLEAALAQLCGDVPMLVNVLDAISGAGTREAPRLDAVWSGPDLVAAEGRTTRAAATLLDSATDRIYATTYSAGIQSPYISALRRAVMRGVEVTVVVDTHDQSATADLLAGHLQGAWFWTLTPAADGSYAVQHAKLVLVDDRAGLITSANLSAAAADRNLECGLLTEDAWLVQRMRRHLDDLFLDGYLIEYAGGRDG